MERILYVKFIARLVQFPLQCYTTHVLMHYLITKFSLAYLNLVFYLTSDGRKCSGRKG